MTPERRARIRSRLLLGVTLAWAAAGIAAQVVLGRATWYYECGNGIRSSSDECAPGSALRTDDGLAGAIGWSALTWVSLIALVWVVAYVVVRLRARRRERARARAQAVSRA